MGKFSDMFTWFKDRVHMNMTFVKAAYIGRKNEKIFEHIEYYCIFIGYPRSGHSLIGSLLDAHPNIIIANELNALQYIRHGFNKQKIFALILKNSQEFTQKGREWTGYSYAVPNQWNGKFRELKVVGDKKGGGTVKLLTEHPALFERITDTIDIHLKCIHVIRNPYDNISTMSQRHKISLSKTVTNYFARCETIATIRKKVRSEDWIDVRHEALIDNPCYWIKQLCQFLEQECSNEYLHDCASIVYTSPHKSRYQVSWPPDLKCRVECEMKKYPFLSGYTYES